MGHMTGGSETVFRGGLSEREGVNQCDLPIVKCVLVGDGAVGKTSLLVSYASSQCPAEYVPTAFDNYAVIVRVDDKPIRLQLCDTAGQEEFDLLHSLCFSSTDVFLICFSVVQPSSLRSVTEKWLSQIRSHCSTASTSSASSTSSSSSSSSSSRRSLIPPIILVGTQSDQRTNPARLAELGRRGERPVTVQEATSCARHIGAAMYIECSAVTQNCVKDVFDSAIFAALDGKGYVQKCRGPWASFRRSTRYKCRSVLWREGSQRYDSDSSSPTGSLTPNQLLSTKKHNKQTKNCRWKHFCCFSAS